MHTAAYMPAVYMYSTLRTMALVLSLADYPTRHAAHSRPPGRAKLQLLASQGCASGCCCLQDLHVSIGFHVYGTLLSLQGLVHLQTVVCACADVPTGKLQGRLLMRKAMSMPSLQVILGVCSKSGLCPTTHYLSHM